MTVSSRGGVRLKSACNGSRASNWLVQLLAQPSVRVAVQGIYSPLNIPNPLMLSCDSISSDDR